MRQRLSPESNRIADRLWSAMQKQKKWWSVNDISVEAGASGRYTRRYVRALKEAGYVKTSEEAKQFQSSFYKLIKNTGNTAPILRGRDGSLALYDPNLSSMSGDKLKQIREQLGINLRDFAALIGVKDPRTVKRYEEMEIVPPTVAEIAKEAKRGANGKTTTNSKAKTVAKAKANSKANSKVKPNAKGNSKGNSRAKKS